MLHVIVLAVEVILPTVFASVKALKIVVMTLLWLNIHLFNTWYHLDLTEVMRETQINSANVNGKLAKRR